MKILLSPTFLDSFTFFRSTNGATDKKRQEIIDYLNGIKTPDTEAQAFGKQFEADVCDCIDGKAASVVGSPYWEAAAEFGEMIDNVPRQVHVHFYLTKKIIFHGYIDFLGLNVVDDVKTTKTYTNNAKLDLGKYYSKFQHRVYLAALNQQTPGRYKRFRYLIYDRTAEATFIEEYRWQDAFVSELADIWRELSGYLK